MNARSVSKDGWTIKLVPKDETGQQLVLEEYKPSRLTALRLDPGSFSSTLAREQAFADDVWIARLMDPLNRLFLAVDNNTHEILSTVFLREFPRSSTISNDSIIEPPITFGIYGLWTLPTARRRGIARALLEEVMGVTRNVARLRGSDCQLEVEAYKQNEGALQLYRSAGFEVYQDPASGDMQKFTLLFPEPGKGDDRVA